MPQYLKLKVWPKTKLLCYGSFLLVTNPVSTLLHVFHSRKNRWKNFVKRSIILKFDRNIIRYPALCLEGINMVNYYSPSPCSILKKRKRDLRLSLNKYLLLAYSVVTQMVKNLPAMGETWVWFLGWEDLLKESMVTHSSILAWRIPQRSLVGYSSQDCKVSDTIEWLHFLSFW